MSWDQILTLVGGMGKGGETPPPAGTNPNPEMNAPKAPQATPGSAPEAPSFAKKASETMLGSTPRTDSVPNFTGDVMQGMTNPHGLVGQAVRLVGAIASFGQGVGPGMQYLNLLNSADAAERGNVAEAASRGWTPEEYRARTGQALPPGTQTAMQARNMPISGDPNDPQDSPSMPNQQEVIQFPNTPEELTAARDAELRNKRSMPNFGVGSSRQEVTQQAQLAQRQKLPLDSGEKTVLTQQAAMEIPDGMQFRSHYGASDEGLVGQFTELPPEDQSMDMATYDKVTMPEGYSKIPIPDQKNPGQMYMKIVNTKTGIDFWDEVHAEAARTGGNPLEIAKAFYTGRSNPSKVGSPDAVINQIQQKIQRVLSPDELSTFKSTYGQGAKDLKPGESEKRLQDFLIKVGYMEDPAETAALDERRQQYEQVFGKKEAPAQQTQPSGPPTPSYYPNTGGTPNARMTPGPAASEAPSFPPNAPRGLPMPAENKAAFKKKTFADLQPQDISFTSGKVLEALTRSGDPSEAGKVLAQFMERTDLNDQEKQMTIFSIVQELGIPNTVKLQIEKAAMKDIK
jgi:hypothetical protein